MLITENLYLGAYALVNGATLERVSLSRSNGRTTAVFESSRPGAEVVRRVLRGTAVVNLQEYRRHLEALKDSSSGRCARTRLRRAEDEDEGDPQPPSPRVPLPRRP